MPNTKYVSRKVILQVTVEILVDKDNPDDDQEALLREVLGSDFNLDVNGYRLPAHIDSFGGKIS